MATSIKIGAIWNDMYFKSNAKDSEPLAHPRMTAPVFLVMWNLSDKSITCVNTLNEIFLDACALTYAKELSFNSPKKFAPNRNAPYATIAHSMSDLFSLTRSTAIFNAIGEVTLHSLLANKKNIAHKSMNLIHICSFGHKYGTKDHSSSLCNFQNDCFCSFLASLSIFLFRLDSRLFPFISSASPLLSFRWTLSKAVTPAAFTAGKGGGFSTSSPAPEVLPPFPPPFFVKADILLGIFWRLLRFVCLESYSVSSLRRPYVRTRGSTDFYYVFEK